MNVYQLTVLPFACDMDFDDWKDNAIAPNLLFLTLDAAKQYCSKDNDREIDEMEEADDPMPRNPLIWEQAGADAGTVYAECEETGLIYTIYETEVR